MSRIVVEYLCPTHERFESFEDRETIPDVKPCPECGLLAEYVISAPKTKTAWGAAASTMKSGERPPGTLDTRPLAEGMKKTEWDAMNAKKRRERQWNRRKERAR